MSASRQKLRISPGPWEWQGRQLVSLGARSTLLREVMFWNPDPGDKPLIAAAPDLIAALRSLANDVAGAWSVAPEGIRAAIGNTNYQVILDKLAEAEAAIAKAEGIAESAGENR